MKNLEISIKFNAKHLQVTLPSCAALILIIAILPVMAQIPGEYQPAYERALAAGLDPERVEALFQRAHERQIPPDDIDQLVAPAVSLAEQGLPYHPVLQKAMEGMAKRIPPPAIHQVLVQMENGFTRSVDLVDPWLVRSEVQAMIEAGRGSRETSIAARSFRDMILENTSYALQNNTREETIRDFLDQIISERVTERSGMTPVASAIRALADLPTSDEDPAMNNRILVRALNNGFTASEIQQLADAFRTAQFHSRLPVENIARGLHHQMGEGIPARHILDNLFQGNVGGGPPGFTPPGLDRNDGRDDHPGRGRRPDTPPGRN